MNTRLAERGQSLVLVALLLFALMGMLAVVLDGGNAFFQQRIAQNAADSGALAGARELCITHDPGQASTRALEYALTRNGAQEADALVQSGLVTVTTRIPFTTWFGSLLGRPELTARATATAGCFTPSGGTGVLPVAWSCRPHPTPGDTGPLVNTGCQVAYDHTYIIMDSQKSVSDIYCQNPPNNGDPNALDCDFNNDGVDDYIAGGDRSWLDLNGGGGGSSELADWVNGTRTVDVNAHTWYAGNTGVENNVFQAAANRIWNPATNSPILVLPVFNEYCDGNVVPWPCPPPGHHPSVPDQIVPGGGAAALYYHVITFSLFKITCVDAPGVRAGHCPAKEAAVAAGFLANNTKTIEGQFVRGFVPGLTGRPSDGADAGAYTLYLIR